MPLIVGAIAELPREVPVVIAGGGPSGMFLALDLAHRGIRSVVIEPRASIDHTRPRAKTTNARTMTHLRRIGLADRLRMSAPLNADYAQDVIFCSSLSGYEVARFTNAFQVQSDRYELQPESGQQVAQPIVEEVLREAIARSPLVSMCVDAQVTGFESGDESISVRLRSEADEFRTVEATYLIGADGGSSVVRRELGIAFEGSSANRSNFNILFRSTSLADLVTVGPAVQYWTLGERASGIVGRADLAQTWWAIVQGVDIERTDLDPAKMIVEMAGCPVDVEVVATDGWTARMLLAETYGVDRVFLIGDAAHLNPPWGGHGFNTSIGDAANLAWKLAAVMEGWGGPKLLESYGSERRPIAERTIRDAAANGTSLAYHFATRFLGAAGAAGETARRSARDALQVKRSEFHSLGLVLGYDYSGSSLITEDGSSATKEDPILYEPSARPGRLLPHAWLADGSSLYDSLDDRGFTLLLDASSPARDSFTEALTGLAVSERLLVRAHDAAVASIWSAPAVLVRPDQHVAWRGSDPKQMLDAWRRARGCTTT